MVMADRLSRDFEVMAAIGAGVDGGITRLAFSDADWEARRYVMECMRQAGLAIRTDAFGNVIGRMEGTNPQAPVVMLGSHIDSVPDGGNYDGVAGVLAAIEVARCLREAAEPVYHPVEVVVFMAEESSRFGVATLGSKAFCGKLHENDLKQLIDVQGVSLATALEQRGLPPADIASAKYDGPIRAFLELHIEQGKVLEATGTQLGIVTAIAAPTRMRAIVTGKADHSGATPMDLRQDALTAAAEIILLVEKLAQEAAAQGIVGTTGIVRAEPGVMNVIPGRVELGIDIRGISMSSKQAVLQNLKQAVCELEQARQVSVEIQTLTDEQPVQLSAAMTEFLSKIAAESEFSFRQMPSGAGHDAMHIAPAVPTGMIFIPCKGGISHNPAEWSDIADVVAGTEVLYRAVQRLAVAEEYFGLT